MCNGVRYLIGSEVIQTYFPNPKSTLPIKQKNGDVLQVPWGRRKEQLGKLPATGWARLDSIHAGKWDRFTPVPVKLPLLEFAEKDISGKNHWYEITKGQIVQGLLARLGHEQRVYVVTIEPEFDGNGHDRWPRLMNDPAAVG